jgi:hypothetical protein
LKRNRCVPDLRSWEERTYGATTWSAKWQEAILGAEAGWKGETRRRTLEAKSSSGQQERSSFWGGLSCFYGERTCLNERPEPVRAKPHDAVLVSEAGRKEPSGRRLLTTKSSSGHLFNGTKVSNHFSPNVFQLFTYYPTQGVLIYGSMLFTQIFT